MYQYLIADDFYLEHNKNYTPITYENVQFLVNLEDCEAPIFQAKQLIHPFASLIGNYCVTDSSIMVISKIDPIFACIKVLTPTEKYIEFESLFNRENQLAFYLSTHKSVVNNIDLICMTKLIDEQLYVKYEKSKLFEFLELKFNAVNNYIENDPQQTFQESSFDTRKSDQFFTENCVLFQEYLPPDIYKEFFMKKQKERGDFPIMFFQERQDNFEIEKLESKKKSQQEIKQTATEQKLQKDAKSCLKLENLWKKQQQQ